MESRLGGSVLVANTYVSAPAYGNRKMSIKMSFDRVKMSSVSRRLLESHYRRVVFS